MNENIEERINLQKALFEIEDANVFNKTELRRLEEFLETGAGSRGREVLRGSVATVWVRCRAPS